jgi:probable F420-dependent oxidoreductase
MKIGVQVYLGGEAANPDMLAAVARAAEAGGFHSFWLPEHVVLPPKIASRYPYSADGSFSFDVRALPFEPFIGLAYAAAVTMRIRLGTGVSILPQRHPVYTAKQAADVDVLSKGRLDFGIGVGWLAEEFAALGVPFARRGARARDYVKVMLALWSEEVAQYRGEFYSLPPVHQTPKPAQKPHPPLYFGGESDAALGRVAEFGQGWFAAGTATEALPARLARLDALLAERGRRRAEVELFVGPPDGKADLDAVKRYRDAGAAQVILGLAGRNLDRLLRRLDDYAESLVVPARGL